MRGRKKNWTVEFKRDAIARMDEACGVAALAAELGVGPERLYEWRRRHEAGGADALRRMGRPRLSQPSTETPESRPLLVGPEQRIAELERTIGQQQVDLNFFRAALRRVAARRRTNGGPGGTTSTR